MTYFEFMSVLPVLIVEDDDIDAEYLLRRLRKKGLKHIQRVDDGTKALQYVRDYPARLPLLVFLDINLPNLSGHDVLHMLEQMQVGESVYIVVVTTSDDDEDRTRVQGTLARNYYLKHHLHGKPECINETLDAYMSSL